MKAPFEVVDWNAERIHEMSADAYDFCALWVEYLASAGWTEEEYEAEWNRRLFESSN